MSDFLFVGRYSISNVDFTVTNDQNAVVDADVVPTIEFRNYATNALIWTRASTHVATGTYRARLSSVETGNPGLYFILWQYILNGINEQFRTDIEVPSSTSTAYNGLGDMARSVVDTVWAMFADLFDSPLGGPHLVAYAQTSFGRETVARLLTNALGWLNTTSQPHQSYTLADDSFPYTSWGGLLVRALYIEVIKHLMRSYVEQPDAQGVSPARLDRRDYLSRWQTLLEMEQNEIAEILDVYKMASMNLGRMSVLVGGGLYGNFGPNMTPARPRMLPPFRGM